METAEQSEQVMDCEVEVAENESPEQGNDFNAKDEQGCSETESSDFPEEKMESLSTDTGPSTKEDDKLHCCETNDCTNVPCQDQVKALISEAGYDDLKRNESTTSSVSDTLSSADSVYENESHRKTQDIQVMEQVSPVDQYLEPEEHSEHSPVHSKEDFGLFQQDPHLEPDLDTVQDLEPDLNTEQEQYSEPDHYIKQEQEPVLELYSTQSDGEFYPELEQDTNLEFCPEPEFEANEDFPNPQDDSYMHKDNNEEELQAQFEPQITEESQMEACNKEEVMSDVSESCHNPDYDEMVDCLRAEITEASSDSETDEKWRTIFSSSINKEDDDSYLDSLQLSAQELFVQRVEETDFKTEDNDDFGEVSFEVPQVEGILEETENIVSVLVPQHEVKANPLALQGLSKISEDESENGKDASSNHFNQQHPTVVDTAKMLPKDFCVIQETKSENVSTEHVDFQLARKQWQEMEAQTKNKVVLPTTGQPRFHGSHSFMYTPVRKIERTQKKENDLGGLPLVGDYPQTQFSPCSEDSGLDDSSYRSHSDDAETPVEKEIRISMEREENFKRERDLSRMDKSADCATSRSIPRSMSTPLTPSFIITSSPTKEPHKGEVSVNNVIILDPSNNFSSSPRQGKDNTTTQPTEWCPEDSGSNVIILETSNLIIRSASEFSLSKACEQPQEKMFLNNPFFKLRSRSTISLVDEEIKMVKLREEELKKERASLYSTERFDTGRSNRMDTLTFGHSVDVPMKCKSSPSSPMKTAYRMDRSVSSCDQRFSEGYTGSRRKSAMALRWEAGEFTKSD